MLDFSVSLLNVLLELKQKPSVEQNNQGIGTSNKRIFTSA